MIRMTPIDPAELKLTINRLKRLPKHGQLVMIIASGEKRMTSIEDIVMDENDHAIFFETKYAILTYDRKHWFIGGHEIQVLFGDEIADLELKQ